MCRIRKNISCSSSTQQIMLLRVMPALEVYREKSRFKNFPGSLVYGKYGRSDAKRRKLFPNEIKTCVVLSQRDCEI